MFWITRLKEKRRINLATYLKKEGCLITSSGIIFSKARQNKTGELLKIREIRSHN